MVIVVTLQWRYCFGIWGAPTEGKAFYSKRCVERTSANSTRRRKGAQTRTWARGAATTRPERGETEDPGEGPAEQHIWVVVVVRSRFEGVSDAKTRGATRRPGRARR